MSTTTQAIRDALPSAFERHYAVKLCITRGADGDYTSALTRMLERAWDAATLVERERCAVLVESITARKRWAKMCGNGGKTITPCELAAAIRSGVES